MRAPLRDDHPRKRSVLPPHFRTFLHAPLRHSGLRLELPRVTGRLLDFNRV